MEINHKVSEFRHSLDHTFYYIFSFFYLFIYFNYIFAFYGFMWKSIRRGVEEKGTSESDFDGVKMEAWCFKFDYYWSWKIKHYILYINGNRKYFIFYNENIILLKTRVKY